MKLALFKLQMLGDKYYTEYLAQQCPTTTHAEAPAILTQNCFDNINANVNTVEKIMY